MDSIEDVSVPGPKGSPARGTWGEVGVVGWGVVGWGVVGWGGGWGRGGVGAG